MKFDNSLVIFGGLLLGLSSVALMVFSQGDAELDNSTAVKSKEVEGTDIAEAKAAVSDSKGKTASAGLAELAATRLTGRSSDLSEDRSSEIASDEALPVAHLGDPMLSVDAIDQDFEERHIGDRALDPLSPE